MCNKTIDLDYRQVVQVGGYIRVNVLVMAKYSGLAYTRDRVSYGHIVYIPGPTGISEVYVVTGIYEGIRGNDVDSGTCRG